ncbi:hypothetical protein JYB87_04555 [Shewanella avicenniae]|uniref:Esterase n=1 Tax=Shewanella avicenniae TaxID=2814294 RepID=A0ABX7QUB4_9GAMM|nr:YqiA/YcfP family alpha/beta fold hydrolase [Shewanella avicenniae]QSX34526.1 hypothetical protein JYB87_04555 [Shewanella avicenniae]
MKIFYLHGLGSSGQASTATGLAQAGFEVIAPDYQPELFNLSLATQWPLVERCQPSAIVGTSMGAYYALKLAERFEIPVVAVNACYEPGRLLAKYLNEPAMNFQTQAPIPFTAQMLAQFQPLNPSRILKPKILIGDADEVIPADYQQTFCRAKGWQWQSVDWGHRVGDCALLAQIIHAHVATYG